MHEGIYRRLIEVARQSDVVTYSEIAPLAGLDMSREWDRAEIGRLLGEISAAEHREGRPMLSAVVIHRDNNMPGKGSFVLAHDLDLYLGGDDLLFWVRELRRVHDYRAQH